MCILCLRAHVNLSSTLYVRMHKYYIYIYIYIYAYAFSRSLCLRWCIVHAGEASKRLPKQPDMTWKRIQHLMLLWYWAKVRAILCVFVFVCMTNYSLLCWCTKRLSKSMSGILSQKKSWLCNKDLESIVFGVGFQSTFNQRELRSLLSSHDIEQNDVRINSVTVCFGRFCTCFLMAREHNHSACFLHTLTFAYFE